MSRKSFCCLGSQTLFFRGREATTGNASAVRRLCKVETSANVNNHWETCAMGDDIITNVISTNQHFTSTFLMQIYSNSRDVIASSPFFSRPASRVSQRACLRPKAVIDFKNVVAMILSRSASFNSNNVWKETKIYYLIDVLSCKPIT